MKKAKLHLIAEVEIPENAEVIRFTDQEGITTDHVKLGGKLFRPDVLWMEYTPSKMPMDQANWHPDMSFGWESGTPLCNELSEATRFAEWYMEEIEKK